MRASPHHPTARRLRRVVAPLVVAAGAVCLSVPATAAAAPSHPPAHERASASGVVSQLVKKLLQRGFHKGKPVAKYVGKRVVRTWTKHEAVQWWCDSWYRYFGYDFNRWYYAAQYNWSAYWAWRFCESNGY